MTGNIRKQRNNAGGLTRNGKGRVQTVLLPSLHKPLRALWLLYLCLFALLHSSCEKDPGKPLPPATGNGVYIVNEGNFQFGNAKVSYYNRQDGTVTEDLFQPANNRPLGDVLQSIYAFNGKVYLIVNNSHKIEVVDSGTFVSSAVISGLGAPRYFLPVSRQKAYVTDYENTDAISIIDLNTNTVAGNIPCAGWTEELILSNSKVFVTNMRSNKVYVLNPSTDRMEDSIAVNYASNSIVEDKNGKVWVLCSGNEQKGFYGGLHRINPVTLLVEQSYWFPNLAERPWRLRLNASKDTLYFLNESVFRLAVSDTMLPGAAFIEKNNRNFYGLGIEPATGIVYVADAIDYVQRGMVYRYKPDGSLLDSFRAGIVPGDFWFD